MKVFTIGACFINYYPDQESLLIIWFSLVFLLIWDLGHFFSSHNIILPISFSKTVNLLSTYCFSLVLRHLLYYLFVKTSGPSLKSAITEVLLTLVHSRIRDSHQTQLTYSQSAIAAWAFMRWKLFHASLSDVFLLSCFAAGVFSGPPFPSQLPHIPALFCLLTPTCLRRLL